MGAFDRQAGFTRPAISGHDCEEQHGECANARRHIDLHIHLHVNGAFHWLSKEMPVPVQAFNLCVLVGRPGWRLRVSVLECFPTPIGTLASRYPPTRAATGQLPDALVEAGPGWSSLHRFTLSGLRVRNRVSQAQQEQITRSSLVPRTREELLGPKFDWHFRGASAARAAANVPVAGVSACMSGRQTKHA